MKTLFLCVLCTVAICFTAAQPACVSGAQIKQNGLACAGKEVSASLLTQVAMDLFAKNFGDLEALAVADGMAFINCVVTTTVATQPIAPATGSGAKAEAPPPVVVNGQAWLAAHGGGQ